MAILPSRVSRFYWPVPFVVHLCRYLKSALEAAGSASTSCHSYRPIHYSPGVRHLHFIAGCLHWRQILRLFGPPSVPFLFFRAHLASALDFLGSRLLCLRAK